MFSFTIYYMLLCCITLYNVTLHYATLYYVSRAARQFLDITYIYIYIYIHMCICICTYVYTHVYVYVYVYIVYNICMHVYIMCVYIYIYTHIYIHLYTYDTINHIITYIIAINDHTNHITNDTRIHTYHDHNT